MKVEELEKIVLEKFKAKYPDAFKHVFGLSFQYRAYVPEPEKYEYRIHLSAYFNEEKHLQFNSDDIKHLHFSASSISNCISTLEEILNGYEKTEELDLP